MTLRKWRNKYKLSQRAAGKLLGIGHATVDDNDDVDHKGKPYDYAMRYWDLMKQPQEKALKLWGKWWAENNCK